MRPHPHIANIVDLISGPVYTHAVLEYCGGGTLLRHLQRLQTTKAVGPPPTMGGAAHGADARPPQGAMAEGDAGLGVHYWQVEVWSGGYISDLSEDGAFTTDVPEGTKLSAMPKYGPGPFDSSSDWTPAKDGGELIVCEGMDEGMEEPPDPDD